VTLSYKLFLLVLVQEFFVDISAELQIILVLVQEFFSKLF